MKKIRMFTINKLKDCDIKIFLENDKDNPNHSTITKNEIAKERWLDKEGILDKDLRKEIITNVRWYNDNCADNLRKLGWEVLTNNDK